MLLAAFVRAVMGPDGVASGNTNNVQITQQTLNLEDPRIAGELAAMRTALAAEMDDDDAAIEAGNVASAQRCERAEGAQGRRRGRLQSRNEASRSQGVGGREA